MSRRRNVYRHKKSVGLGTVLLHVVLTLATGGLWLVGLGIWWILNNA